MPTRIAIIPLVLLVPSVILLVPSLSVGSLADSSYAVEVLVPGMVAFRSTAQLADHKDSVVSAILRLGRVLPLTN